MCQPGLYVRPPPTPTFFARALSASIFFSASISSLSVRMMPTSSCIVSCSSAWIAYGFSPAVRLNGSSVSRATASTCPASTFRRPPRFFA